jgi:hypothetical protein
MKKYPDCMSILPAVGRQRWKGYFLMGNTSTPSRNCPSVIGAEIFYELMGELSLPEPVA